MAKFNIGDKVRRTLPNSVHTFWRDRYDGMVYGNVYTVTGCDDGCVTLDGCNYVYSVEYFELVESATKPFTKADLKDGMRVVYRNGEERIVLFGSLYLKNNYGVAHSAHLSYYSDDMLKNEVDSIGFPLLDIVKVYERDGTLLWERGEQTQAQQEYEELQKTIKELQNKADALGKLIK